MMTGETLYSWCARYHRLAGNRLAVHSAKQLFGASVAGLLHDLPSNLDDFVARTNGRFGDARSLALERTLLGFFAPFKPVEGISKAIDAMKSQSVARLKFLLALPPSRVTASHPLKACPDCIQQDIDRFGWPLWHLEHQWPSVWICRQHATWLQRSNVKVKGRLYHQWLLPDDVRDDHWLDVDETVTWARPLLERLVAMTAGLMAEPDLNLDRQQLRLSYLAGIKRFGLLRTKGAVRLTEVREEFLYQARGLEKLPGFEFVEQVHERDGGFLGALLRFVRGHKHPVKHLLAMAFLFRDWYDFRETYSSMALSPIWRRSPLAASSHQDPRRLALAQLVAIEGVTVAEAARQLAVDFDTAIYWAKRDGVPYRRRPRAIRPEMVPDLIHMLMKGVPPAEAAMRSGLPKEAVTTFLKSHQDVRDQVLAIQEERQRDQYRTQLQRTIMENPGVTRAQLRRLPKSGYLWLYRHDREWLAANLPSLWRPAVAT